MDNAHEHGAFSEDSELARQLGLFDSVMVVVGLVIGSGIFLTTGSIAKALPHPSWVLAVWGAGGLICLAGALTLAELGAMMPKAGGQYVFLREAFGDLPAFLFGWAYLSVVHSGSIAAVSAGFAEYLSFFFPKVPRGVASVAAVLLLTWLNVYGVKDSSRLQNVFTLAKVGAILAIGLVGSVLVHSGGTEAVRAPFAGTPPWPGAAAFGVGLIAVLWTFDGWNCITFSAGEVKNPRRNLPLALLLGTLLVTALYVAINYVYLAVIPIDRLKETVRVAEVATTSLFGAKGTVLLVAVVLASTFSSMNAMILTGPRIYFAMARDGLFLPALGKVDAKHGTPAAAVMAQGIWAAALVIFGTYDQLFTMAMCAAMAFYAATGAAVFVLRRKVPEAPRPYRTWGYPVTPLVYIAGTAFVMLNGFVERPWASLAGFGLVATGVPVYLYWRRRRRADAAGR
ncbi:MAG: amino acid permease [Deltaproteobacteria bacterium]|nr:amino acid permease [Deltaproteobacteria bacterium]